MDCDVKKRALEAIRAEYHQKIDHYHTATAEGMPGGNGGVDGFCSDALAEAYRQGEALGLTRDEVDVALDAS